MMRTDDYTIVRSTFSDTTGKTIKSRGYNCVEFYRGTQNLFLRQLRKLWQKYNLPFMSIWYDHRVLAFPDNIVVFDALCTPDYLKWLHKKRPSANINVWFWNIVRHSMNPDSIDPRWCKKWSFSRVECQKYNMDFNPPPYFTELISDPLPIEYDLSFVGRDKGRLDAIIEYKNCFEKMGLKTKFVITPVSAVDKSPYYSPRISYEESIRISVASKAVFDYIEVDNSGQSMRVLECLFQQRKVVTNSKLVVDYDFYDSNNIFVLGVDDINKLPEFLKIPYKKISDDIIMKYDFDNFISRFFEKENCFEYMMKKQEN